MFVAANTREYAFISIYIYTLPSKSNEARSYPSKLDLSFEKTLVNGVAVIGVFIQGYKILPW